MIIILITIIAVGLIIGSFINMLTFRIKRSENFTGRSYCDKSRKQLKWKDLIPVFSYIWYRGKCRECGEKISLLYPIVEIITGIVSALAFFQLGQFELSPVQLVVNLIITLCITYFFIFFAAYDFHYMEVNLISVIIALIFAFGILIFGHFYDLVLFPTIISGIGAAFIGAVFIWFLIIITKGAGMGYGDILLFGLVGLVIGIELLPWVFLMIVVSGAIVGSIFAIYKGRLKGLIVPFGPFISLGAIVGILFGYEILEIVAEYILLT